MLVNEIIFLKFNSNREFRLNFLQHETFLFSKTTIIKNFKLEFSDILRISQTPSRIRNSKSKIYQSEIPFYRFNWSIHLNGESEIRIHVLLPLKLTSKQFIAEGPKYASQILGGETFTRWLVLVRADASKQVLTISECKFNYSR